MAAPILWTPSPEAVAGSRLVAFARVAHEHHGAPDVIGIGPGEGAGESAQPDYRALHRWSIDEPAAFWTAVWDFTGIVSEAGPTPEGAPALLDPEAPAPDSFPEGGFDPGHRPRWFPEARLNFAENLLQAPDDAIALVSWDEGGRRSALTFGELRHETARFAEALRARGIGPGDRVAGFLPNLPETIVAFLGAAAVGASWSSCSPDFGAAAVVDRFGQIEPRLLVAATGYLYKGNVIDLYPRILEIRLHLPSVDEVVLVPGAGEYSDWSDDPDDEWDDDWDDDWEDEESYPPGIVSWSDFLDGTGPRARGAATILVPRYERLPFDHPLAILYSSGTTGLPKCIVHSTGGTLLQHRKEHVLHVDLRAGERLFYFTTCGWMMWNWLVTGLAEGATLVLYDGAPVVSAPRSARTISGGTDESSRGSDRWSDSWSDGAPDILWALAEAEGVHVFGTSARYLALMEKEGMRPGATRNLSSLRAILSTGSPLAPAGFDWVYREVKPDLHLASISGGTDIVSCFVLGVPTEPVRRGEIQGPGLGMAVEVRAPAGVNRPDDPGHSGPGRDGADMSDDETGGGSDARLIGTPGELVCARPFPSMPLHFWNDPGHARYRRAYFASHPGIWRHGDWAEETESGGFVIHGRSDATLNPGGVRIGTAEIYRQVEAFDEVLEAVAIGQQLPGGEPGEVRIVLFVRLRDGAVLDDALANAIRRRIREHASPHHVPRVILPVPDLPRTISGKVSEIAVREVVHRRPIGNEEALANPESLDDFRGIALLGLPAPLERLLTGVIDYAGLFPPAALPMHEAVDNYASYRIGVDRWALGRFIVPAGRLPEFEVVAEPYLRPPPAAPWELSVLVGGDPEGDARRIRGFVERMGGRVVVPAVEAKASTPEDVARVVEAFPGSGPRGARVESTNDGPPAGHPGIERWLEVHLDLPDDELRPLLRSIREAGAFAKIRTGGVRHDLFPLPGDIVRFLRAAIDEGLRFKATAGLHHPLRGDYRLTYAPDAPMERMFGYLNVLLATAVLRAGGSDEDALAALDESDPESIRAREDAVTWGRFRFTTAELGALRDDGIAGFGSCSLREPVDELAALLPRIASAS